MAKGNDMYNTFRDEGFCLSAAPGSKERHQHSQNVSPSTCGRASGTNRTATAGKHVTMRSDLAPSDISINSFKLRWTKHRPPQHQTRVVEQSSAQSSIPGPQELPLPQLKRPGELFILRAQQLASSAELMSLWGRVWEPLGNSSPAVSLRLPCLCAGCARLCFCGVSVFRPDCVASTVAFVFVFLACVYSFVSSVACVVLVVGFVFGWFV